MCRVVSSELNDPSSEKIVARVRLIRFKAGTWSRSTAASPSTSSLQPEIGAVNLQSEITFFSEMAVADKARLMASSCAS